MPSVPGPASLAAQLLQPGCLGLTSGSVCDQEHNPRAFVPPCSRKNGHLTSLPPLPPCPRNCSTTGYSTNSVCPSAIWRLVAAGAPEYKFSLLDTHSLTHSLIISHIGIEVIGNKMWLLPLICSQLGKAEQLRPQQRLSW